MNKDKALGILSNLRKIIIGKDDVLKNVLICLLAKGHLLIEDVPGVGKTTLVKTLAKSMDSSYKRVQFTPDLMPTDIIGVSIYDKNTGTFTFRKGPIFNQIFLADEINRTSPKPNLVWLQAMEEGEVSTEDNHYVLKTLYGFSNSKSFRIPRYFSITRSTIRSLLNAIIPWIPR